MRNLTVAAIAMSLLATSGCASRESIDSAKQGVATFHRRLNAGDWNAIRNAAGPEFQGAPKFIALLQAVARKLGRAGESKIVGWNVSSGTQGTVVTLDSGTRYADGPAHEQFTWQTRDKSSVLVGYDIKSEALVLN